MARQEDIIVGRRLKNSYISTVVSITLVLYVLGLLGLIMLHAKMISDHIQENIGFSVILTDNARLADINLLQNSLDAKPAVKSTNFISKEEAAEELTEELGEDFIEFLGYNPLFPSIDVRLRAGYTHPDTVAVFESQLIENRIVKEVYYQKSLVHLINENVKRIGAVLLLFSILLTTIAFALINNTIRLSVFSKRFLIKSMQLVGATQSFIRKPFVIKGILQGIIGAVISIGLLIFTLYTAQQQIPELQAFQNIKLLFFLFAIVVFLGIIISWISTFFAVRKYLKIKTDNLYFY